MLMARCIKRSHSTSLGAIALMQQSLHTSGSDANQVNPTKLFLQHTFYKGKSALSFHPGRPIFKRDETGALFLEKEGLLFMSFAPSTGPKQYDWGRKQFFALSVAELGGLVSLTFSENVEYFHDPHMGSSNAGKIRKCLKVEGMPDKSGFFFNFSVADKLENVDERFSVPVTKGEFAVLRSSFNFIIPYLMGWHSLVNPASIILGVPDKVNSEMEWAK